MAEGETTDGAESAPSTDTDGSDGRVGGYSLVWQSVRTAAGSDSYLLRAYAVLGTLVAVLVTLAWVLALPNWIQESLNGSGTVTFSRAFLILTGVLVVVPLFAPTIFAARRHRAGIASPRRDALFGLAGFSFVLGLYASLLISAPPGMRDPPPAAVAPVVEAMYALDPAFALVPPVLAAVLIVAVERF